MYGGKHSGKSHSGHGRNTPLDMRSPNIKDTHKKTGDRQKPLDMRTPGVQDKKHYTTDGRSPDQNSPDIAAKFR